MTRPDRVDVDGWEDAQVELDRSWSRMELPHKCSLYRSPSTWMLVTVHREARYGDDDQPVSGRATMTTSGFTAEELAEYVEAPTRAPAWVALLDAGYENDAELRASRPEGRGQHAGRLVPAMVGKT